MSGGSGGEGFLARHEGLDGLVSQLRTGVSRMDGLAGAAPPAPDAGASSGAVGSAVAAVLASAAGLVAVVEDSAGKVQVSNGGYDTVDNKTAVHLHNLDRLPGR